jgi:hypothetical protein
MMKFILAARRKPGDTQERYFYEWGIIHVALMITNPSTQRAFKRYVQHFSINGVAPELLWHPLSPMAWDNMADHWVESLDDLAQATHGSDYKQRMQPHKFGDDEFCVELTNDRVIYEGPGFKSGGVKLIHFLRQRAGLPDEEFDRRWRNEHAALIRNTLCASGLVHKYVQSPRVPLDAALFKGTLFEKGGVGQHAGIEEFWFSGLEDLARLRRDGTMWEAIAASEKSLTNGGSFSMVTTERVVFDCVTSGRQTPKPAVLTPGTLEALIDAQGYGGFNVPKEPGASPGSR